MPKQVAKSLWYSLSFVVLVSFSISAQLNQGSGPIGRESYERLQFNFDNNSITGNKKMPFDVPFILYGDVPHDIVRIDLFISKKINSSCNYTDTIHVEDLNNNDKIVLSCCKLSKAQHKEYWEVEVEKRNIKSGEYSRTLIQDWKDQKKINKKLRKENNFYTIQEGKTKKISWEITYLNAGEDDDSQNTFVLYIPPLEPNAEYDFNFQLTRTIRNDVAEDLTKIENIFFKHFSESYRSNYDHDNNVVDPPRVSEQYLFDKLESNLKFELENISAKRKDWNVIQNNSFLNKLDSNIKNELKQVYPISFDHKNYLQKYYINYSKSNLISSVISAKDKWLQIVKDPIFVRTLKISEDVLDDELKELVKRMLVLSQLNEYEIEYYISARKDINDKSIPLRINIKDQTRSVDLLPYIISLNNLRLEWSDIKLKLEVIANQIDERIGESYLGINPGDTLTDDQKNKIKLIKINIQNLSSQIDSVIFYIEAIERKYKEAFDELTKKEPGIEHLSKKVLYYSGNIETTIPLSSTADFFTRTSYYVSADVGIACIFYQPTYGVQIAPYYGVNFHLGPINKQAKYRFFKYKYNFKSRISHLYKNTSFIIGMTMIGASPYTDVIQPTFTTVSLLSGIGIRISDPIRLSGGFVWNSRQNENPLVSAKRLFLSPYIALSYDLDVEKFLGKVGAFFTKQPQL